MSEELLQQIHKANRRTEKLLLIAALLVILNAGIILYHLL